MRLFCDQCGTEFGIEILRTDSRFCTICGKSLSDYVKKHTTSVLKNPPKTGPSERRRIPSRSAKRPAVTRPTEKPSKKRRNADAEIGVQEEEEEESDDEGRRNTRSRRRPLPVSAEVETNPDDLETSTTEGNQDTEETEVLMTVQIDQLIKRALVRVKESVNQLNGIRTIQVSRKGCLKKHLLLSLPI